MKIVINIGSLSEAWRALTKIAAETQGAAYDRAKKEFESLEIGGSESVAGYFARVHVTMMRLARHQVTTPAREIKHRVQGGLTPRFPDEVQSRDSVVPCFGRELKKYMSWPFWPLFR